MIYKWNGEGKPCTAIRCTKLADMRRKRRLVVLKKTARVDLLNIVH